MVARVLAHYLTHFICVIDKSQPPSLSFKSKYIEV